MQISLRDRENWLQILRVEWDYGAIIPEKSKFKEI